ncbi:MAG: monofunctional biosynthetic peptidoglycan transglycosylase [Pararhodobacter sp.]
MISLAGMGKSTRSRRRGKAARPAGRRGWLRATLGRGLRWAMLGMVAGLALLLAWVALYRFVNPPGGIYMWQESRRLGGVAQQWVPMERIAPVMARSAVAAEDANFCLHWGFDMVEIRRALDAGAGRGASTITQQVVKNTFLWHGRSWLRKALEALMTPMVEALWSKRRILEVYLNIAELDTGVFGVEAAARHYFDRSAADLTARHAALLAAVLPAPQSRSAARPSDFVNRRARSIADGAATIARDGRAACFDG